MLKNMRIFLFNWFLLLGFFVIIVPDVLVLGSPKAAKIMEYLSSNRCRYSRVNSMLEAQCDNLELDEIPLHLRTDIQVLDVTGNMIGILSNDSLHPYKELKCIYLRNNYIHEIRNAVFANQPYLQVLDLSQNFCKILSKSLFQLPYLHTLYLGDNMLHEFVFNVNVTSPLRVLDLNGNWLSAIPNLGVQPTLLNLNVSENFISSISTEDLAPFCSLKELDLTRNYIRFNVDSCDCQTFNAWIKLRQIKMKPDLYNCTELAAALDEDCVNVTFSNRTYELFHECSAMIQQEIEKPRSVWLIVAPCVSVFLFVVFVTLFCVHERNRRRCRKQQEQLTAIYNNTDLNTELLQQQFDDN